MGSSVLGQGWCANHKPCPEAETITPGSERITPKSEYTLPAWQRAWHVYGLYRSRPPAGIAPRRGHAEVAKRPRLRARRARVRRFRLLTHLRAVARKRLCPDAAGHSNPPAALPGRAVLRRDDHRPALVPRRAPGPQRGPAARRRPAGDRLRRASERGHLPGPAHRTAVREARVSRRGL